MATDVLWSHSIFDQELYAQLEELQERSLTFEFSSEQADEGEFFDEIDSDSSALIKPSKKPEAQEILLATERSCCNALQVLEKVLDPLRLTLNDLEDVTGRTNSIVSNCEMLLEKQHTLQQTAETLENALKPFKDIEDISVLLGIPNEYSSASPSSSVALVPSSGLSKPSTLDPRSPEFFDILVKLASSSFYLKQNEEGILEAKKYLSWVEKLKIRAISLINKGMKSLIERATGTCKEIIQHKTFFTQSSGNPAPGSSSTPRSAGSQALTVQQEEPLESSFIYQKFRGLSFRMKELLNILLKSASLYDTTILAELTGSNSSSTLSSLKIHTVPTISSQKWLQIDSKLELNSLIDVRSTYAIARNDLVSFVVKESFNQALNTLRKTSAATSSNLSSFSTDSLSQSSSAVSLSGDQSVPASPTGVVSFFSEVSLTLIVRQIFSVLLRLTQLECQLFDSLFSIDQYDRAYLITTTTLTQSGAGSSAGSSASKTSLYKIPVEISTIIEHLSNVTRSFLRPYIIKESKVDELCRIISTLSEDILVQVKSLSLHPVIIANLMGGLHNTISDAKERLIYCSEKLLREKVQLFEPLPSQLNYPSLLEAGSNQPETLTNNASMVSLLSTSSSSTSIVNLNSHNIVWYPPLKDTLNLLSKLYNTLPLSVFEDFAQRSIEICLNSLSYAHKMIQKNHQSLHADLFLVRNLLILREQILPFDIKYNKVEKNLDFYNTKQAFSHILSNKKLLLSFNLNNSLLKFATQGLPNMNEKSYDSKRELDYNLKQACFSLKLSIIKEILGSLDSLIGKINVFCQAEFNTLLSEQNSAINKGNTAGATSPTASNSSNPNLINYSTDLNQLEVRSLSEESINTLKTQSFLKADRIAESFAQVQQFLMSRLKETKTFLKLYIENSSAQSVIIKSVIMDFQIMRWKMDCVLLSCLSSDPKYSELSITLKSISQTVLNELS